MEFSAGTWRKACGRLDERATTADVHQDDLLPRAQQRESLPRCPLGGETLGDTAVASY